MSADVRQAYPTREILNNEVVRCARHKDLAAMACSRYPSCPVDLHANVIRAGNEWLAGVDPHPDADVHAVWPRGATKHPLRIDRACNCVRGARERDEERIALCVDLVPVPRREGGSKNSTVLGEQVRVATAQPLQQLSRPLDIGE